MITVWLRLVDAGTDNECWMICAKGDLSAQSSSPPYVNGKLTRMSLPTRQLSLNSVPDHIEARFSIEQGRVYFLQRLH